NQLMQQMDWITKATEMAIEYAPMVLGALLTLIIGFLLAGYLTRIARKAMEKRNIDASLVPFISSLINVGIKLLVLLSAASMFGFEVTSFVAILGALA
ncbi:MAG TPA: mechanosensitive ion channel protein, partial [Bacteroidetes bacterium]|nr:mechanosensitive ion channel protein [Bacteroidota bacterium]